MAAMTMVSSKDFDLAVRNSSPDELMLALSGRMNSANAGSILQSILTQASSHRTTLVKIDLSSVSYLDSAGMAALLEAETELQARGITLKTEKTPDSIAGFLNLLDRSSLPKNPCGSTVTKVGIISHVGESAVKIYRDFIFHSVFIGELVMSMASAFLNPRKVRWSNILLTMQRMGVDALPIVCLISFLVGLTIAFQSAVSLRQFGANIYLADLVGLSMVRELGPLMTAILVAGRSGSAFAAEIGTMMVSEEVDSLVSMGFDPFGFLVTPRILAAIAVLPILSLFADVLGILGGMVVGIASLDLTVESYISETYKILTVTHVFSGILKSLFFGIAVAFTGCLRGFQVSGGAESVGERTTSSVVTSIFLIVVIDSIFGVIYQVWDI